MLLQFPKKLQILEDIKQATNDYSIIMPKPYSDEQRLMMTGEFKSLVAILGTKTGKTLSGSVRVLSKSFIQSSEIGARYRIIAPVYQQAMLTYQYMQRLMPKKVPYSTDIDPDTNFKIQQIWQDVCPDQTDSKKLIQWAHNQAVINAISGENPDTVEGDRQMGVLIDEMAKVKEATIAASISTTTQTKGWHAMFTTPTKGKNHSYRIYMEHLEKMNHDLKMGRTPDMVAIRMPSWVSPYSDKGQIEKARKILPKRLFDMLYGAEFVDGSGVFNHIGEAFGNVFNYKDEDYFVRDTHDSKLIFIGVDFAKKVDYTVFYGLNEKGQNIGWWRMQGITYAQQINCMWQFADTLKRNSINLMSEVEILFDETGVGGAIKEIIDLSNKYNAKGLIWNNANKCDAVYQTIAAFEQKELKLIPWNTLKMELEYFEAKETGTGRETFAASDGNHDDCVLALIMAVMLFNENKNRFSGILTMSNMNERLMQLIENGADWNEIT
jgi:hypothetical protein